MTSRRWLGAVAVAAMLVALADRAAAQVGPKADPNKLVTKTYDLNRVIGGKSGLRDATDTDAVVKLIFESIQVGEIKPGADGPQFVERDGGKLEVRATEKVHDEIKDLISSLERLADLAVDIKADVFE